MHKMILTATVVFSAWSAFVDIGAAENNTDSRINAAPSTDTLLAMEKQAREAYFKGNSEFFEHFFSDNLVQQEDGSRLNKAQVIEKISGTQCEVKAGWTLTEPFLLKIDNDAYVLSYESNVQGSCMAAGKVEPMPSPVRAATVWIRNGDGWQAAFHGENLIIDFSAPSAAEKKTAPSQDDPVAASTSRAVPAPAHNDPITTALKVAENSVWNAWMKHDPSSNTLMAKEIAFVNLYGAFFANKAAVIENWTSALCEVTSFKLTDVVGTAVSPTVGILTLTGTVKGSCGGQDISGQKIYGNTVYVKDGNAWKWVFGFNQP